MQAKISQALQLAYTTRKNELHQQQSIVNAVGVQSAQQMKNHIIDQ